MIETELTHRTFTLDDLNWFAAASGDWNPIHVDPVQARRLLTGDVVVHGMFALIWALNVFFDLELVPVRKIKANFSKPVLVGRKLRLFREISNLTDTNTLRLSVRDESIELIVVLLTLGGSTFDTLPHSEQPPQVQPKIKQFSDLSGAADVLKIMAQASDIKKEFYHASQSLGSMPVAALMGLSRLVGMECPGMHSVLTGIDLDLDSSNIGSSLTWHVSRLTVPQAPVRMSIDGSGLKGWIDVFMRPVPVSQLSMVDVTKSLTNFGSFAGQVALVVGGSRGIGELTAKIIAAGGGEVILTFLDGYSDASRVVDEIIKNGGRASALQMDVTCPEIALKKLKSSNAIPTHLYYFAAPRIAINKKSGFDISLWKAFITVFVEAFSNVVLGVKSLVPTLHVFYPSTVFIDELPSGYAEYVAAKLAGESLCRHLTKHTSNLDILVRRLPRILTDQTVGLIQLPTSDPLPLMLDIIRSMHSTSTSTSI